MNKKKLLCNFFFHFTTLCMIKSEKRREMSYTLSACHGNKFLPSLLTMIMIIAKLNEINNVKLC